MLLATHLLHIHNETNHSATDEFKPAVDANQTATPQAAPLPPVTRTTRSGRHAHFPARFNI
jgi:hypothetical protein